MLENEKDLLEDFENLPENVKAILSEHYDVDTYKECELVEKKLNAVGYTIEWGLDAVLYDLKKI